MYASLIYTNKWSYFVSIKINKNSIGFCNTVLDQSFFLFPFCKWNIDPEWRLHSKTCTNLLKSYKSCENTTVSGSILTWIFYYRTVPQACTWTILIRVNVKWTSCIVQRYCRYMYMVQYRTKMQNKLSAETVISISLHVECLHAEYIQKPIIKACLLATVMQSIQSKMVSEFTHNIITSYFCT